MERIDALATLERITRHWDIRLSTSQHDHWMQCLTALDADQAGTTFARMMKQQQPPSPAQFVAAADTYKPATHTHWCEDCHNTGVITDTNHPNHWPTGLMPMPQSAIDPDPTQCHCNMTRPCHCQSGATVRVWMDRMQTVRATDRNHHT